MILSHDPSKTWGESLLCSLALAKRRHKQGYDAVKLAAACGIPGPETGLPGGRGKYGKLPKNHPCRCFDFRAAAWIPIKSKSDTMRPGRSFSVSGLIHVILMIQYERKGAAVMSHTPAYTVIQTPEADKLADIRDVSVNKDLPREERIAEFVRQIRDPYHFKCGGFVVRASFSHGGATLEECLRGILR